MGCLTLRCARSAGTTAATHLTGCDSLSRDLHTQSMDQAAAATSLARPGLTACDVDRRRCGRAHPFQHTILQPARRPIPALNQPQQIFRSIFWSGRSRHPSPPPSLKSSGSLLDLVMEDAASRRLGKFDQQKFDEYLDLFGRLKTARASAMDRHPWAGPDRCRPATASTRC